ncbi:hypothetical protein BU16DRAFT_531036, partial [Lophium mytilinum]
MVDSATPELASVRQWLQTVPIAIHSLDEFARSRPASPSTPPTQTIDEDLSASYSNTTDLSYFDLTVSTTLNASPLSSSTSLSGYQSCVASLQPTPCKILQALAFDTEAEDEISAPISHDEVCGSTADGSMVEPEVVRKIGSRSALDNTTNNKIESLKVLLVTSCLHCVLAKLPCSRTLPACTRCIRNGRSCLPQRRRTNTELVRGDPIGNALPIPLYLPDEDAETRASKVALNNELMDSWKDELDKKNWVLPTQGRISGFPRRWWVKRSPRHPGEGIGIVTYQTVRYRRL